MILIKTYIEQLPPALEESASLDGAGYLTCFFKIVLPLCKPIIATVVVFVAVGQWNSWFDNHIYTRANENYGRCCKRLICEIEIKEMRNLWYLFIRIDSRGSFGK